MAASSLYKRKNPLGDFHRRVKAKVGQEKTGISTAGKMAILEAT
jgi:hypothetical protein